MAEGRKKLKRRAHPWAFPLGLLITLLAAIGLVTVIVAGVGGVKRAIRRDRHAAEYERLLTPVVMNDPDPFDDLTKANPNQLIDITIWSILKSGLSPDRFTYEEEGMLVPETDVNEEFRRLFGTEVKPQHATVVSYGYEFVYDAEKRAYLIPLTGDMPLYTPSVIDVDRKKETVVLTVGYLAGEQWAQNSEGDMVAPEPDKYMKVTLRKNRDGSLYISALQAAAPPETALTEAPSSEKTPDEKKA